MQEDYRMLVIKNIFKDITNLKSVIKDTKHAQDLLEQDDDLENLENHINSTKKIVRNLKKSVDKIHNYFDKNYKSWSKNSPKKDDDKGDNATRKSKSNSVKKTVKDAKKGANLKEVTDQCDTAELPPDVSLNDCEVEEKPPEPLLEDVPHEEKDSLKASTEDDSEAEKGDSPVKKKTDEPPMQQNDSEKKDEEDSSEEAQNDKSLEEAVLKETEAVPENKTVSLEKESQEENEINKNIKDKTSEDNDSQNVTEDVDEKDDNATHSGDEKRIDPNEDNDGDNCVENENINNPAIEADEDNAAKGDKGVSQKPDEMEKDKVAEVEQNKDLVDKAEDRLLDDKEENIGSEKEKNVCSEDETDITSNNKEKDIDSNNKKKDGTSSNKQKNRDSEGEDKNSALGDKNKQKDIISLESPDKSEQTESGKISNEKAGEKGSIDNSTENSEQKNDSEVEAGSDLQKEEESHVMDDKEGDENKEKGINVLEKDDMNTSKDIFEDDKSIEIINDSIKSEPEDIKVKTEPETFGKIKLVCLSKLIDPIHKAPKVIDSIVILSDSDDEPVPIRKRTRSSTIESLKNNNNKASPKLNTSKSILKVRNLDTTDDVEKSPTPKKVKFADKDKMILSKIKDSDDSSDSNSEHVGTRAKYKSNKKGLQKKEECLAPDGLDSKFSWKSYIKLPKIPAEKLKAEYMKKMEKLELKRLMDMKTLRKRSRTNKESSSSDESTKPAAKKKSQKSEKPPKKVSQPMHSDSSDSSDIEDNNKLDTFVEAVDPNTPEMNGTDSEIDFQTDMDSTILDTIVASDEEKSDSEKETEECAEKKNSDSDDENNTQNGDEDEKLEENGKRKEKSDEEKDSKKSKTSKKDSDDSASDDDDKKGSSKWKRDKLLTEKLSDSDSDVFERVKKISEKAQAKSTTKKKIKRIIPDSESDNESKDEKDSSEEEDEEEKKESSSDSDAKKEAAKKKSRKRIKKVNESSSDDEDKSTRKQIRKVLNRDSLAETTKQAEKEEAERKARIAERQKKYNDIFEADKLEKSSLNKVVLDFNEETNEELLDVHKDLVKHLKPHQGKGVQFMWDACFESIDRAKNTAGSGCILAHCMGLGKTLQVITLAHTLLTNYERTGVKKVLVVCPLSTVLNWVSEFKKWLPSDDEFEVYDLVSYKQNRERLFMTSEWHKNGGVLVLGYDMFRNLSNDANKRITKKMRLDFKRNLVDPGPDLVVCDEGHLLKNEKTSLSISMNKLKTIRRIVLTGTPLQNNLKEYWCMVQFVKPNLLGTYKEYLNRFVNPITNGQYTDSTPHDIQIMRKRSHVLHKLLDGIVQRRDYSVLAPFLPPKHEYILFVSLTETQVKLYSHYMKEFAQQKTSTRSSFLFVDFQELQRICTHPRVLLDKSIQNKIAQEKKDWENDDESEGSIKDFLDDGSDSASSTPNSSSGDEDEKPDVQKNKFRRRTRATAEVEGPEVLVEDEVDDGPQEWWRQYTQGDELDNIIHSGKLHLLFEILHQCELIGDKVLVFSQSLYSLNVIEYFLSKIDEAAQNGDSHLVGGYSGSWALGLDYFRLDGSSSCDNRAAWCKTFNDPENTRARLFLISTRAGGLGINLVAANRVVIFDVSWNPSHDIQSIYRVYRFGQLKPSYIYRFVTMGTMEMKIYERQVTKQAISKRVIDEQQIDRHYNQNDLQELYKFEPEPDEARPTPLVPKDILLGELLQSHNTLIYKYHEHQSLLENKEDEVLDEAERKAAWEEFENEKKARNLNATPYQGNINQIPMGSIVTALTNIIKREQPTFTINEINGVMPQLVQELNGQMRVGDFTMYNKIINEIKSVQTQVQQQKLQEYYQMQQQQNAIKLFQKYQQQFQNSGVSPTETANFVQQWQNAAASSNTSRRNVPATIDPEVIKLDD